MSYGDFGGRSAGGGASGKGEPGEEAFAALDTRIVARLSGFVRPYRYALIGVLAVVALFVAIQIGIPLMIRMAVDSAVGNASAPLDLVIAGFVVLVLLSSVVSFLQEWSAAIVAQHVIFDLRRAMFVHLQDVSTAFVDQTHVGRIMSRIQGDVNSLQEFLETSVQAIGDFFLLLGIIAVLLWMDWRLGLLTLSVLPLLVLIRALWLPSAKATFRLARDTSSAVNAALAENINGVRTVQGARREALNFAQYEGRAESNFRAQIKAAWTAQIMVPSVDILTGVSQAIICPSSRHLAQIGAWISGERASSGG